MTLEEAIERYSLTQEQVERLRNWPISDFKSVDEIIKELADKQYSPIFEPTNQLRWRNERKMVQRGFQSIFEETKTLQQLWIDDIGNHEWRDVPTEHV